MLVLLIGLVLFLGIHSVRIVAPGWRDTQLAAIGEGPWKGVYSLVALVGFVLIVWGYSLARPDAAFIYEPPSWIKHVAALLMLLAFISLAVSLLPAGKLKPVLKHPMLLAVKIWAVAHLIANGDLASILLFGSFLAWAVIDRVSLKRRDAPIAREGALSWDIAAIVAGVVVYLLFVWQLHAMLFGVLPFG